MTSAQPKQTNVIPLFPRRRRRAQEPLASLPQRRGALIAAILRAPDDLLERLEEVALYADSTR